MSDLNDVRTTLMFPVKIKVNESFPFQALFQIVLKIIAYI